MREKLQKLVKESKEEKEAIEEAELKEYIDRIPQILESLARLGYSSHTIYEHTNCLRNGVFSRPYKLNINLLEQIFKNKYPDLTITRFRFGNIEDALTIEWN